MKLAVVISVYDSDACLYLIYLFLKLSSVICPRNLIFIIVSTHYCRQVRLRLFAWWVFTSYIPDLTPVVFYFLDFIKEHFILLLVTVIVFVQLLLRLSLLCWMSMIFASCFCKLQIMISHIMASNMKDYANR